MRWSWSAKPWWIRPGTLNERRSLVTSGTRKFCSQSMSPSKLFRSNCCGSRVIVPWNATMLKSSYRRMAANDVAGLPASLHLKIGVTQAPRAFHAGSGKS
jgi:hypothetical protein